MSSKHETNLLDLMLELTQGLPKSKDFSRPQGTKYTNEGLSTVIEHKATGKLYKILLSETTISKELPRLGIRPEDI